MWSANRRKVSHHRRQPGLAGGSAAATLGELGYNVDCFAYQDNRSAPAAISAQGGISGEELSQRRRQHFPAERDTVKGGDYRSRRRTSTARR